MYLCFLCFADLLACELDLQARLSMAGCFLAAGTWFKPVHLSTLIFTATAILLAVFGVVVTVVVLEDGVR